MKNNKNEKIFLSILLIATLIIALVGATFAFFSSSGGSANNAVTANATTLSNLGFTITNSKVAYNLVPVASQNEYFYRYPGIASSGIHSCLDDVGNEICSIYEFTITNTASIAQTVNVSLVPSENTFDNLYFAAFNTTIASASYVVATGSSGSGANFSLTPETTSSNSTLGHQATKLIKNSTDPIEMSDLSINLASGASVTYTVLIWLQEIGSDQNTEQGGRFKAGIKVNGVTNDLDDPISPTIPEGIYLVNNVTIHEGLELPQEAVAYSTTVYNDAPERAMADWENITGVANDTRPFFLRFTLGTGTTSGLSGVPVEGYVGFVVTPEMVSENPGMIAGTYYLKSWVNEEYDDNKPVFNANLNIMRTAFGFASHPERCYGTDSEMCSVFGLEVYVGTGTVSVTGPSNTSCFLEYDSGTDGGYGSCH